MIAVAARAAEIHPSWAFLVPDKEQPKVSESEEARHLPGSTKAYTPAQIDDLSNPPEWYPEEHGTLPAIVQHGKGAALMKKVVANLSEDDMIAIAAYAAAQQP
jgi:cytochrome c553